MMLPMAPRLDGGGERQATRTDFAGLEQPHALFAAAAVPEPPAEAPRGEETEQLVTNFAVGRVIVTCAPESAHFDHCFNSKCRGQGSVRCSKCERSFCMRCIPKSNRPVHLQPWTCSGAHTDASVNDFEAHVREVHDGYSLHKVSSVTTREVKAWYMQRVARNAEGRMSFMDKEVGGDEVLIDLGNAIRTKDGEMLDVSRGMLANENGDRWYISEATETVVHDHVADFKERLRVWREEHGSDRESESGEEQDDDHGDDDDTFGPQPNQAPPVVESARDMRLRLFNERRGNN